jgi:hypothetical protein
MSKMKGGLNLDTAEILIYYHLDYLLVDQQKLTNTVGIQSSCLKGKVHATYRQNNVHEKCAGMSFNGLLSIETHAHIYFVV